MPFYYVRSQDDPLLTGAAFKEICEHLRAREEACRHLTPFRVADKTCVWLSGVKASDYAKEMAGLTLDANHVQINVPVPSDQALSFFHAVSPDMILSHEAHHVARLRAVGNEEAFGTAGRFIVSEGLALHFEAEAAGRAASPCPFGIEDTALASYENEMRDAARLKTNNYLQSILFFGQPLVRYPRFIGYALGARLVGNWLKETGQTAAQAHNVKPDDILEPWLRGKPLTRPPTP